MASSPSLRPQTPDARFFGGRSIFFTALREFLIMLGSFARQALRGGVLLSFL